MLDLVDFILAVGDLFLSWRLYAGLALTATVCWLGVSLAAVSVQWFIAVPLGIVGIFLSFRWQFRADDASNPVS